MSSAPTRNLLAASLLLVAAWAPAAMIAAPRTASEPSPAAAEEVRAAQDETPAQQVSGTDAGTCLAHRVSQQS